ncbi:MAG TPA: SIR2 family protein [Kofleriaceae bacterium]|nr:SIR2 family protein [Kofleriaceae bacterium]
MDGEHVERLHRYYREGKLRVLVGAGVSMAADFPSWDALNRALLHGLLEDDPPEGQSLEILVEQLYGALGRESTADFVWQTEDPGRGGNFFRLFVKALYEGRTVHQLPIPAVASQLASMADRAGIYTTNYDPLLELGLAQLHGNARPSDDWQRFRAGPEPTPRPCVRHIHGWVDPDGHAGGTFVLTESQYIALQSAAGASPNRDLAGLLEGEGAVLIVGMSLGDPNLRRLLYLRALSPFVIAPTYAVIKKSEHQRTDELHQTYWRLRKTTLISIDKHESLLPVLRQIQHGVPVAGQRPNWLHLAAVAVAPHDPFNDAWQTDAWEQLRQLRGRLTRQGQASSDEIVEISLFRVMADVVEIRLIASTRPNQPRTRQEAIRHAEQHRLSVRVGEEQGIAGLSFASGLKYEALNPESLNSNFTPAMIEAWKTEFASLVAVPIHAAGVAGGERFWVPVGVIVATSSFATVERSASAARGPCWREDPASLRVLREAGERLLLGKT